MGHPPKPEIFQGIGTVLRETRLTHSEPPLGGSRTQTIKGRLRARRHRDLVKTAHMRRGSPCRVPDNPRPQGRRPQQLPRLDVGLATVQAAVGVDGERQPGVDADEEPQPGQRADEVPRQAGLRRINVANVSERRYERAPGQR